MPRDRNVFFDLFLEDGTGELIDIPIMIKNFRDRRGNMPNTDNKIDSNSRLVRRFFIYDTVSGI